jgi:hypothetical protein
VLPILQKIQKDIADFRRSSEAKANDMAENIIEMKDDVAQIKRDTLMHLGLTTKYRVEFEELRGEVDDLKARVAALESRS